MAAILIVENEPALAVLMADALTDAGYSAHPVNRASEAIDALAVPHAFDLVLMDILLQTPAAVLESATLAAITREIARLFEYDGVICALALRGMGYDGPIVAVTGDIMQVPQHLYARAGFIDRVSKPFKMPELLAAVARNLPHADVT